MQPLPNEELFLFENLYKYVDCGTLSFKCLKCDLFNRCCDTITNIYYCVPYDSFVYEKLY